MYNITFKPVTSNLLSMANHHHIYVYTTKRGVNLFYLIRQAYGKTEIQAVLKKLPKNVREVTNNATYKDLLVSNFTAQTAGKVTIRIAYATEPLYWHVFGCSTKGNQHIIIRNENNQPHRLYYITLRLTQTNTAQPMVQITLHPTPSNVAVTYALPYYLLLPTDFAQYSQVTAHSITKCDPTQGENYPLMDLEQTAYNYTDNVCTEMGVAVAKAIQAGGVPHNQIVLNQVHKQLSRLIDITLTNMLGSATF